MKILVLGNGFDLDHNLPTGYMHFLNFCNCALNLENEEYTGFKELTDRQKKYIQEFKKNEKNKEIFLGYIRDNYLLDYFNSKLKYHGNNWIDFERELKEIAEEFKAMELAVQNSDELVFRVPSKHRIYRVMQNLRYPWGNPTLWDERFLIRICEGLCQNLERFSKALEFYIANYINKTSVTGISPDIVDFAPDKVLTFNYSNTYRYIYAGIRRGEVIDYVHGKAKTGSAEDSNIILGITSSDGSEGGYVKFEKYYQRIIKKTGSEYKKWLQSPLGKNEKIEVLFFGHSLDSSDSDIIKDLLCHERSEVTICYYNEAMLRQIVANLIEILGKDQIIAYVSGDEPKLIFRKQKVHCNENTAGIEISKDVRRVYSLHTWKSTAIDHLLQKIREKIADQDLNYFYSQNKVIDLFDALRYQEINLGDFTVFAKICNRLDYKSIDEEKPNYYQFDDWSRYTPWDEDIPCDKETAALIEAVNYENKLRLSAEESNSVAVKISDMHTGEEIETALLQYLSWDEGNSRTYWENLDELVRLMAGNRLFEEVLNSLKKQDHPIYIKVKIKHFVNMYDEYNYYKQMEEYYSEVEELT